MEASEKKSISFKRVSHWRTRLLLLILLFLVTIFISLNLGFIQIPLQDTLAILLKNMPGLGRFIELTPSQSINEPIIMLIRMPRILIGALVGAALAASGTVYQGLFRNPMADPYTISASQGAALGAALAIVLGLGVEYFGTGAHIDFCIHRLHHFRSISLLQFPESGPKFPYQLCYSQE